MCRVRTRRWTEKEYNWSPLAVFFHYFFIFFNLFKSIFNLPFRLVLLDLFCLVPTRKTLMVMRMGIGHKFLPIPRFSPNFSFSSHFLCAFTFALFPFIQRWRRSRWKMLQLLFTAFWIIPIGGRVKGAKVRSDESIARETTSTKRRQVKQTSLYLRVWKAFFLRYSFTLQLFLILFVDSIK